MTRMLIELWPGCWRIAQDVRGIDVNSYKPTDDAEVHWLVKIAMCEEARQALRDAPYPISMYEFSKVCRDESEARATADEIGKRIAEALKATETQPNYVPYPVPSFPAPPMEPAGPYPWSPPFWANSGQAGFTNRSCQI